MNLVGKIFTVLIFVMSLVFMTFSTMVYMTHKNWMAVIFTPKTGLDAQLADKNREIAELNGKVEQLDKRMKADAIRHRNDMTRLEGENKELREERAKNEKILAAKDATIRDAAAAMLAAQEQLKNLRDRNTKLELDVKAANTERDAKFKEVVRLTDELHNAKLERTAVENRNIEVVRDLTKYRAMAAWFKINVDNYKDKPVFVGMISAVPRPDLVEISGGADDAVLKGHNFDVTRGGDYIGRIEVIETQADRAVCRVDAKMLRQPMQRGDRVQPPFIK